MRDDILRTPILNDFEPLSFRQIQELIQVDVGIEQNVNGSHKIRKTPFALRHSSLYYWHQQPCNKADPYLDLDSIAIVVKEVFERKVLLQPFE